MSQITTRCSIRTSRQKETAFPEKKKPAEGTHTGASPFYTAREVSGNRPADRFSKDDLLGVFALYANF